MDKVGTASMAWGNMQQAAELSSQLALHEGLAQAYKAPAIAAASLAPGPGRQPAMRPIDHLALCLPGRARHCCPVTQQAVDAGTAVLSSSKHVLLLPCHDPMVEFPVLIVV